jgi:hypothetical protein
MDEHVRFALLAAFRHVYRPLVRLALRNGISFKEFANDIKPVFIESAREDFGSADQMWSRNRVAILTGLSRNDVDRYDEGEGAGFGSQYIRAGLISRLIEAWTSEGDFTGPYGIPLDLEPGLVGPNGFGLLVKRYGEGFDEDLILAEMRRVGAAEFTKKKKIRLRSRSFIAAKFRPETIDRMGRTLADFAETLEYNLDPDFRKPTRFERRVYTPDGVDAATLLKFRDLVAELGQDFLEKLDNWLSEKEQEDERRIQNRLLDPDIRDASKIAKVGVGVFMFEHHNENFVEPFKIDDGPENGEQDNEAKEIAN